MEMKHLLLTKIAIVVLARCGPSVDIYKADKEGNITAIKQYLAAELDMNPKYKYIRTALARGILYQENSSPSV